MSVRRKIVDCLAESKEIFIGLEVSKKTWVLCVRADRAILHEISIPARYEVLRNYLAKHYRSCEIHVVYEAGFSGFGLFDSLIADGYQCTVVPPHTVVQAKCSRVKNDRSDAKLLAKNLEDGNCKSCHVPDEERRGDREVVRTLDTVIKEITRVKNRIRKKFDFHGIETGINKAAWNDRDYKHIRGLLVGVDSSLRAALEFYFNQLDYLLIQKKELKKLVDEFAKKERYAQAVKIAQTLPGIGKLTAIRLILELGEDFSRFKTGSQIASFVGLGGCEHSSGSNERKGGITKQGSSKIRAWLIESAWIAINKDMALKLFYRRIRQNTGQSKKAIVAVARKLLTRLRTCIVNNTAYVKGIIK